MILSLAVRAAKTTLTLLAAADTGTLRDVFATVGADVFVPKIK
jgi:hypothetical protein